MADLDRVTTVNIYSTNVTLRTINMRDIMVVGTFPSFQRVTSVRSTQDLAALGIGPDNRVYSVVNSIFSQAPCPPVVYLGALRVDTMTVNIDNVSVGQMFTIAVKSRMPDRSVINVNYVYKADEWATKETVAQQLVAKMTGDGTVKATATGATITLEALTAEPYGVSLYGSMTASVSESKENVTTALNEIAAEFGDWYYLIMASRNFEAKLAASVWTEANRRMHAVDINDPQAFDGGDAADELSKLFAHNFMRTFVRYHFENADTEHVGAALIANRSAFIPGSATFHNQRLNGISPDKLSEAQANVIWRKGGGTFERVGGYPITQGGKVLGGEWIDNVIARDFITAELQQDVATLQLKSQPKLPQTDHGLTALYGAMFATLSRMQRWGLLAEDSRDSNGKLVPGFSISVPRASEISDVDKQARNVRGITFEAKMQNAIHHTDIVGFVGV